MKIISSTKDFFRSSTLEYMRMRSYPLANPFVDPLTVHCFSVNDLTVPYITAAIELEDPFLDHEKIGMTMYVPLNFVVFHTVDGGGSQFDPKYEPLMTSFAHPSSPPVDPPVLSKEWIMQWKPRIMLPPILQREFPLNIVCRTYDKQSLKMLT